MSDNRFKIVFDGALLPGVEQTTAQLNLAELFKTDVASVQKLFSGRPVALKRDLSVAEAHKYLEALQKAGIDARIEEEPAAVELSLADINELPATTPPPPTQAYDSPYAPPTAQVGDTLPAFGPLKVFTLEGRIGRLRYLAWNMVAAFVLFGVALAILLFAAGSYSSAPTGALVIGIGLGAIVVITFILVTIQISVQRLHDIGWSGWLWLLTLVPFIGSVLPFILTLSPGNKGANQYGAPPPPNSTAIKVLSVLSVIALIGIFFAGVGGGLNDIENRYKSGSASYSQSTDAVSTEESDSADAAAEAAAPPVDYEKE